MPEIPNVTLGVAISKFITGIPLTTSEKAQITTSLGITSSVEIDSPPTTPGDTRGGVGAFFDDTDDTGRFYYKVGLHKWVVSNGFANSF